MKLALAVMLLAVSAQASPYFIAWPTKSQISHPQTSIGAVTNEKGVVQNGAFTNLAIIYHPADPNNSIIADWLQPYIPPESWSLLNLGYGGGLAGVGSSVNLAATVQGYVAEIALTSNNKSIEAFGAAVKPGASPLSINAGPEWFSTVIRDGTLLPFDQWKGVPGWFIGGAYKF